MTATLSHPIEAPEDLPKGFIEVEHTMTEDSAWHFALALAERSTRGYHGDGPTEDTPTSSLVTFHRTDPDAETEVIGHLLEHEVDAADWLDKALAADGYEVVSSRPTPMLSGRSGDVVARWTVDGTRYAGRFTATKWGPRLFIISCRAREEDYDALADEFLASIATFEALDHSRGVFAENVIDVAMDLPAPWRLVLPESWDSLIYPEETEGGWFEANHVAPSLESERVRDIDGRLLFAVLSRSEAARPRDAGNILLRALHEEGLSIEHVEFASDEPPDGFSHSWYLVTPLRVQDADAELRCRVMMNKQVWVVAAAFGPTRDRDDEAWMRNKRALDVATSTLEVDR